MLNRYSGPYKVVKKHDIPGNLYEVADVNNPDITENVPVVRLKRWYIRNDDLDDPNGPLSTNPQVDGIIDRDIPEPEDNVRDERGKLESGKSEVPPIREKRQVRMTRVPNKLGNRNYGVEADNESSESDETE